jgi:tRNA nucleotidyltransferase (CCA-adding enzyme)
MPRSHDPPRSESEAIARLCAASVPAEILEVARTLQHAGHAAVLVGGAVRDVLLGLPAEDWDLATSATPTEVQSAFRRTVPTGIDHGTITVLVRSPGRPGPVPVEVTTFRGEADYIDGRRPSAVVFHRSLVDDLARRDFTVNALAWDPWAVAFTDPFGGLADLEASALRAVGDPVLRFSEDGLRTMRAVRLCATRQFALEPATAAAIPGALAVLAKVSRERVHVELVKLLAADVPSLGLVPMHDTGIWPLVLAPLDDAERGAAIDAVDRLPNDAVLRLARLQLPHARARSTALVDATLDGLRLGRGERSRLAALLGPGSLALADAGDPLAIRRACARLGRDHLESALALLDASDDRRAQVHGAIAGAPLSAAELAVKGRDLVAAGIATPGPQLGVLLGQLFEHALAHPEDNTSERLLALARGATPV